MADIDTYEYQLEVDVINDIIKMIDVMIESGLYDYPTLEELKQRLS